MHVALARKYRPKTFAELIGQEHVARGLSGALAQNRVAHGYLLSGPRGVGKTTAARILAMALNCETRHSGKPTAAPGEPCGSCASCQRIWSGSASLDVVEIDAASNRGVDDARDLRERAMYAASQEGRHKVYIVDEAHMLTREAWNTLLKILEEPPPGVVFVFATTEPHKITNAAAPVMSRLQRFDFRRVGPQAIAARLTEVSRAEGIEIAPDAIELIARVANGGMRDGLSVLDQVAAFGEGGVDASRVRQVLGLVGDEVYGELLDIVVEHHAADVFPFVARLVEAGVDLVAFAEGAGHLWRAALAARLGTTPDGVSAALAARITARTGSLAPGDLLRLLRALEDSEEAITRGGTPRLALETLLVRWAVMDRTVDIAKLLERGEGGRVRGGGEEAEVRGGGERGASASASVSDIAPSSSRSPISPVPLTSPPSPAPLPSPLSALTLESARSAWPDVLDALRAEWKMTAENLAQAEIAGVDGDLILLRAPSANALVPQTVRGKRAVIEAAAGRVLSRAVRVAMEADLSDLAERPRSEPAGATKAQRISVSGAKAERARALRGKDPALDSAMDALDLEPLD